MATRVTAAKARLGIGREGHQRFKVIRLPGNKDHEGALATRESSLQESPPVI